MIPQGMTNEQFALWLAVKMPSHTQDAFEIADNLYKWLEKKQEERQMKEVPPKAPLKYYNNNGQEIFPPYFTTNNIK